MSVEENLMMGGYPLAGSADSTNIARSFALFPILAERRWQAAARCQAVSSRCSPSASA